VSGNFNTFNGLGRHRIARLHSDGSIDESFDSQARFNDYSSVSTPAIQSDGNFVVGGSFISFDGVGRNRIARVFGGCVTTFGTDVISACSPYTWIDGNTYTESSNTATHTLTNFPGCDSVVTLNLTINKVSDNSTIINDATITANNISATYTWLDCDDNFAEIPGEVSQSYTATRNGNYAVSLNENGCVDTSDCVAITVLSTMENEFAKNITLYPNPTQGNFFVDLGGVYKEVRLSIVDLNGKLVRSNSLHNTQTLMVSMEEPTGVYLITIQADGKKAVVRLVKE
jgi:hypothetical protein